MNIRRPAALLAVASTLLLAACHPGHRQSSLHPAAEAAARIGTLWWVMFIALAASFVLVMALTWLAITRAPAGRAETDRSRTRRLVVGGGFVFPGLVLLGMLVYSLGTSAALRRPAEGLRIEVTGYQWWWDVRYPGEGIATANELHIPAGEPVVVELLAADVIHSFWVPNLHGKIDLLPDLPTRIVLQADQPGEWRGQCAEFCGRQHAWMAFKVVALPRPEFDAWVLARRQARAAPKTADSPLLRRGEELFFRESCHACHAVGGTRATALLGPDLTHLGSRLTLGAGRVANTDEHLARWILDPQELKPGNLMPATPLPPDDLAALGAWLRSLR
jgi:cytochrome c oxidase subunit 2